MLEVVDPEELAQEFVLVADLLNMSRPDSPVCRWLEYQAYTGFTRYVNERGELPEDFGLFTPDADSLRDWIAGKKELPKSFVPELRRLLEYLKTAGSGIFDDLCRFYCVSKTQLEGWGAAASLLQSVAFIKALIVA